MIVPAGLDAGTSRSQALRHARDVLEEAGIAQARGEARLLVLNALALTRTEMALRPDVSIGEAGAAALDTAVRRRRAGEPVARILGEWEFWGMPFALSPETLVPRPDTETLVETALSGLPDRQRALRILDLGTGSGCILLALLRELPNAFGIGVDRAPGALVTARANAGRNGLGERAAFVAASWSDALAGPFDLIVSNPPYIASATIQQLSVEVARHDPRAALDGGADGLDAYRAILGALAARPALLAPHGSLIVEIGHDQARALGRLAGECGFREPDLACDLAGHARVVTLRSNLPATGGGNKAVDV